MRGITPIIAIILLLLMAVAAAGAAYLWITMMQSTISTQTQSGLDANVAQMQKALDITSVWNETGGKVCMVLRNVGTSSYTSSQMSQLTFYVDGRAYDYNSSGLGELASGATASVCICNSTDASGTDCVGPTDTGYDYAGAEIDIKVEPPVGVGDTYNNFQNTG